MLCDAAAMENDNWDGMVSPCMELIHSYGTCESWLAPCCNNNCSGIIITTLKVETTLKSQSNLMKNEGKNKLC